MTTTHTIAMAHDMLLATAPDGDDALLQERIDQSIGSLRDPEAEASTRASITVECGLVLFATEVEAEAAGAEIVYSGTQCGWLEDADGRAEYACAGRVSIPATDPWTGMTRNFPVERITRSQLDHWAPLMDDELRERLHADLAPCQPVTFIAAWAREVGDQEAGRVLIGS